MKKIKILELCQFSAGICGVWTRVREESIRLSKKGYDVRIFSSNATKGSKDIACQNENLENIRINRFSYKKLGGESFMKWNFIDQAIDYSPDIIIAHVYRHLHTTTALKIKEKLEKNGKKCKVFLVTHAPFVPDNSTRSTFAKLAVNFYDKFIGPKTLNKFDKILYIAPWEIEYLLKLGVKKQKLIYSPNGISEQFFYNKNKTREENKILFFGRISPIKSIETVIKSLNYLNDKKIFLEIAGPSEENYKKQLEILIKKENLQKRVIFTKPIFDINEKIRKLDSAKIFILSSKKEGMPQSLIEAMARQKVVIGSNISAIKDIVSEGKNGYLFKMNDENDLAKKLDLVLKKNNNSIKRQAEKSVEKFKWPIIISKLESLF